MSPSGKLRAIKEVKPRDTLRAMVEVKPKWTLRATLKMRPSFKLRRLVGVTACLPCRGESMKNKEALETFRKILQTSRYLEIYDEVQYEMCKYVDIRRAIKRMSLEEKFNFIKIFLESIKKEVKK